MCNQLWCFIWNFQMGYHQHLFESNGFILITQSSWDILYIFSNFFFQFKDFSWNFLYQNYFNLNIISLKLIRSRNLFIYFFFIFLVDLIGIYCNKLFCIHNQNFKLDYLRMYPSIYVLYTFIYGLSKNWKIMSITQLAKS